MWGYLSRCLGFLLGAWSRTLPDKNELANACRPEVWAANQWGVLEGETGHIKGDSLKHLGDSGDFDHLRPQGLPAIGIMLRCYFTYRVGYVICDTSLGPEAAQQEMEDPQQNLAQFRLCLVFCLCFFGLFLFLSSLATD